MPLIRAIQCGELGIVRDMLAAGADPNRPFEDTTRLVRAVQSRYPGVVRALLDGGTDPALRAPSGVTPWQAANAPARKNATVSDEEEIRQTLLAAGANE